MNEYIIEVETTIFNTFIIEEKNEEDAKIIALSLHNDYIKNMRFGEIYSESTITVKQIKKETNHISPF